MNSEYFIFMSISKVGRNVFQLGFDCILAASYTTYIINETFKDNKEENYWVTVP